MRIAVAGFADETCTFCYVPTDIDRFEPAALRGQAILDANRGIPTYINGYMKVAEAEGVELVPLVYASKTAGGFQSWLTPACFDKYASEIADRLRDAGPLEGVLLALHGAMAATGVPKPEAEIVRRARATVGSIPIMVTLDLHANEDREMADAADAVFVIRTYPHVDYEETGMVAARCMIETIRGNFVPAMAMRRPGIVSASIYQATAVHPMKDVQARCREWQAREPDLYYVSVAPGYAYADVPDIGMSVWAVTNGNQELAERVAQDISDYAWSMRESFARKLPNPRDGVAEVMRLVREGKGPVMIADGADRIGDTTHILRELLEQGAKNWAIPSIVDAEAAKDLEKTASVGDTVTVKIGGWYYEISGRPVEVTGTVEYMGRPSYVLIGPRRRGDRVQDSLSIRLNLGDNRHVVISDEKRGESYDSTVLTSVGVDVSSLDIVALKDRVHHRAYWDAITKVNYPIDAPGIGLADLTQLKYENAPYDAFPIGGKYRG
ncbi:MAG: M81 family metallopeptidase [Bacillota bacterium]|nr:M81 family metallopeptidase [Bacillota bacterium]